MSSPGPAPLLRVVVVTYSPGKHLEVFLDSLTKATTVPYEVVLADNGSTDGAPQAAAVRAGVALLHTGGNLGYGGGVNAGARAAGAPWLLMSNPDIRFEPGAVDALLDAAARWPRAGALGPAIVTPLGELYPSARDLPSLTRGIGHALFGWWWPTNPWTVGYRRERGTPAEGPVGWLSGSCLLVSRTAFEGVGGFDEGFFMYFEDLDLGERLGRAGWLNVHVPSAVVVHEGGHATQRTPAKMAKAHHDSAYRYLSRRYSGPLLAPLRLVLRAGLEVRYLVSRIDPRVGRGATPGRTAAALEGSAAPPQPDGR